MHVCLGAVWAIYSSARDARAAARACLRLHHRPGMRALATGATWTSRTLKASWAARAEHTSVIDAAGSIYVIGGRAIKYYSDVWISTDGGADRTKSAVLEGVLGGYSSGYLQGYSGYSGMSTGT